MQRFTNRDYLISDQYRDSSKLDARVSLHQRFSTNPRGWFDWVFDQFQSLPPNAHILELGCGSGELWRQCLTRIPPAWIITLSDISDGMLDTAWRNLVILRRPFKFEKLDAQSIPYPEGTFDAVIANHMLYHVPDRKLALTEIKRVLKQGGHLFASTVGVNHMQEMYAWLRQINTNPSAGMFENPFTIESGAEQLSQVFPRQNLLRYEDGLRVTELDPLIAYIRSSLPDLDTSNAALDALAGQFSAVLETRREINISKDSGIFIAEK